MKIELTLSPGVVGERNPLVVRVVRQGRPVSGARVTVRCEMPEMAMGEQPLAARETEPGTYTLPDAHLSMSGRWRADVRVAEPAGTPEEAAFDFTARDR